MRYRTIKYLVWNLGLILMISSCAGLLPPDTKPGKKLAQAGDHKGALAYYESLIETDKATAKVYRLAYEEAFLSGKRVTAGKYYDLALREGFKADSLQNLAVALWYDRALTVMAKDDWDEARKAAEQISGLAPGSKQDKFCGLILAGKKKYDRGAHKGLWDAVNDYTKASILEPGSGLPHFLMGQARIKNDRNDYDAALEDYYKALELEPQGLFADRARADVKKIEANKAKMNAFWGK